MPKNIIYCADGTWSHPNERKDGKLADTNVRRFFDALPENSLSQVKIYDPGVGTQGGKLSRLFGGAFGDGLIQNVKEGYQQIASVYEPGDKIYLVGFSRGAYTARSIAGMIASVGLPAKNKVGAQAIEDAFLAYRDTQGDRHLRMLNLAQKYGNTATPIEAVGVWDTVGALGIPGGLFANWDQQHYGFLDTTLHPNVKAGFHAIAIDEKRRAFAPTLWTPPFAPDQKIKQIWFPGVHGDVGGGYPDSGPADITFGWMMRQMCGVGVTFKPHLLQKYAQSDPKAALGALHDSWSPFWWIPKLRDIAKDATLSNSVPIRMQNSAYRPQNLAADFPASACGYGIENTIPNTPLLNCSRDKKAGVSL